MSNLVWSQVAVIYKLDKQPKSIDNVINDLAIAIKKKKEKIGFFDLETQNLFVDLEPKWNS